MFFPAYMGEKESSTLVSSFITFNPPPPLHRILIKLESFHSLI